MKKSCCILLALLLVLAMFPLHVSAENAEDETFTMRRGIVFGDTIDTLTEKAGVEFVETSEGYYKTTQMEDIANIVNVEQHAYFDENGKLTGLTFTSHSYILSDDYGGWAGLMDKGNNDLGFNIDVFEDLGNRLSEKYGKTVKTDDTVPVGYALKETFGRFDYYSNIDAPNADLEGEYCQWILPNEDGSLVKIECSYIYYNTNTTNPFRIYWDLIWGYTLIDSSVVDAIDAAEQAINDDL